MEQAYLRRRETRKAHHTPPLPGFERSRGVLVQRVAHEGRRASLCSAKHIVDILQLVYANLGNDFKVALAGVRKVARAHKEVVFGVEHLGMTDSCRSALGSVASKQGDPRLF